MKITSSWAASYGRLLSVVLMLALVATTFGGPVLAQEIPADTSVSEVIDAGDTTSQTDSQESEEAVQTQASEGSDTSALPFCDGFPFCNGIPTIPEFCEGFPFCGGTPTIPGLCDIIPQLCTPTNNAPSVPTNGQPHDTTLNTNSFTFTWNASTDDSAGAVTYEFQSSLNPASSGGVLTTGLWQSGSLPSNSIVSGGAQDGTWYWQVRAKDSTGQYSAWSPIWNVTLDTAAFSAPIHVSPANNATVTTSTFEFDWSDVTGSNVVYDWLGSLSDTLKGDGSFLTPIATHLGLTTSSVNSPGTPDNTYFWQVRARADGGKVSAWTAPWKVTVNTVTPPEPRVSEITDPTADEVTSGTTALAAYYADQNADGNDAIQWAVRQGTCAASTGTVFGNVDGHTDAFAWNGADFTASFDTTTVANGSYCFVFNPVEDAGHTNQRLTRVFSVNNVAQPDPEIPVVTSETVTVTPTAMQGWAFAQEAATGSGSIVTGPAAPLNDGSANLVVDSSGGELFGAQKHLGVKLADIVTLTYRTYRASGGDALAPSIQLNIDTDTTDANTAWQGRLVYEPYYTQTVNTGEWQTWNALDDAAGTGTGNWWFSNGGIAAASGCTQANPCTWSEVKAKYPSIAIHSTLGAVGFKAGSNWAGGFNGNVDAFVVGVKNGVDTHTTTYDFEPDEETVTEPETQPESRNRSGGSSRSSNNDDGEVLGASTEGEVLGASCPLITSYLKNGAQNDSNQMTSLQSFLNGEVGSGLEINGMFDAVTFAAVKAFQSKYAEQVLAPWGLSASDPTGYVYKTTLWKINDIACPEIDAPFPTLP